MPYLDEAARAAYLKARNQERWRIAREQGVPAWVVHGLSAYNNWGCGCDICKAAKRAENANLRARNKARKARVKL